MMVFWNQWQPSPETYRHGSEQEQHRKVQWKVHQLPPCCPPSTDTLRAETKVLEQEEIKVENDDNYYG